jgi:hypothetical protein
MSLLFPEKEYHKLQDMMDRWHLSLTDLQYYAAHGHFETMVWLHPCIVNVYQLKKTEDGEMVPVFIRLQPHKGYAIIGPDELHEVFHGSCPIRKFTSIQGRELLEIQDNQAAYPINITDLVISRQELNRFERLCSENSHPPQQTGDKDGVRALSFPGRPSTMHLVRQHFLKRQEQGQLLSSLQQEANYLQIWAAENIKEGQPPKAKTIMNALRDDYRRSCCDA